MHEYMSTARVWGLTCPGFPEEVSRARRWTRDILRDSPLADDAELIVSELSTNAVRHTASGAAAGSFHLAVAVSARVVAVSVTDDGGAETAPEFGQVGQEDQDQEAEHGRGLGLVGSLAHRVLIRRGDGGCTVTAELVTGGPWGGQGC
ncbi:Anti-sigma regulatory factor (Ser/Thr protein kinase) [Streptomyces sp. DI166]|uniref:ATP-binding protein n=1 Tax=Streptomyces sp. DI166 TaxID=1839783 RepID=UPI0007F541F1|nr:ATP-binding protein [Streptomyces sp. DI166]SBT92427.1 Anti-sigma regulatory factor (Ser/Thr protein kinase) [Streptomyces sp. DI166]